jgi:hypothetical protein
MGSLYVTTTLRAPLVVRQFCELGGFGSNFSADLRIRIPVIIALNMTLWPSG